MFLNTRSKPMDLQFYETLEKRCELSKVESGRLHTYRNGFTGECLYDQLFDEAGHEDVLIYRDLYLQTERSVTQYDALIINDDGIVVNEIKNYTGEYRIEGGEWFRNDRQISENPAAQLSRATGKLIRIRNSVNAGFNISGRLIFVSDDFYLQTDDDSIWRKLVVRMDLKRYMRSFRGGHVGNKAQYIARLISERIVENPYFEADVDAERLQKGFYCGACGSFSLQKSRFHLVCSSCGSKESNETHLLRALADYQCLFYGKPMPSRSFMEFIGYGLSRRIVQRVLLEHCDVDKKGNQTTYSLKYRNFEEKTVKLQRSYKYKDYLTK